ncbi:hypothetical protein L218DRAFT_1078816 [Marasmius fiardii PR-910]|nr:hypothetical protein L218DRAFT_1078816 [Marasmius fiardii PR-910]
MASTNCYDWDAAWPFPPPSNLESGKHLSLPMEFDQDESFSPWTNVESSRMLDSGKHFTPPTDLLVQDHSFSPWADDSDFQLSTNSTTHSNMLSMQVGTVHDGMLSNNASGDDQNNEPAPPSLNSLQPSTVSSELNYHSSTVSDLEESTVHNRKPSAPGSPEFAHNEIPLSSPRELPSTISPGLNTNIPPIRPSACNIELHSSHPSHEDDEENTSQAPSTSMQQLVNPTIGYATFNNLAQGDQVNQYIYTQDLLWDKIAGVGASHNSNMQFSRGSCMPGTCKTVLQLLHEWKNSGCQTYPVCWLSGAAGVGNQIPKHNNPDSLILSIAHGLIVARPYLQDSMYQRITSDPHILDATLEDQYEELVLKSLNHSSPSPVFTTSKVPDLVVIDGLDECGDDTTQQQILNLIFSTYHQSFHFPL